MAADPITAVASALNGFFGLIKPVVDESFSQKYNEQHKQRMVDFQEIMEQPDDAERGALIGSFVRRLLDEAGTPPGSVSGNSIEVPVEYFQSLVIELSQSIKSEQLLGRLTFKAN